MSTDNSSDNSTSSVDNVEILVPGSVQFWIMLLSDIPSTICSFCIIVHIIFNRTQRHALYNHTILLILLCNLPVQLLDINFYLVFYRYGSVQPPKPITCLLWLLADDGFYDAGMILMAWLAIERHILIFHDGWVSNRRGRFLFHYLPLIVIIAYVVPYYTIVILFPPCENTYDFSAIICGASPCLLSYGFVSTWELTVNSSVPIIVEIFVSIGLILRVYWQKRRLHQSHKWRKQRRMIIQLFLVSGLNTSLNLPLYTIPIAQLCGVTSVDSYDAEIYFYFLGYFVIFLFPFASLCQYPELRKKIKNKIVGIVKKRLHRTAAVAPIVRDKPMNRPT
jgi:hypothetical protein